MKANFLRLIIIACENRDPDRVRAPDRFTASAPEVSLR